MAVFAISLALLVVLVLFFESRDESSLQGARVSPPETRVQALRSPAIVPGGNTLAQRTDSLAQRGAATAPR